MTGGYKVANMELLSIQDLTYYVTRCELLDFTSHENYKAARVELEKRKGDVA